MKNAVLMSLLFYTSASADAVAYKDIKPGMVWGGGVVHPLKSPDDDGTPGIDCTQINPDPQERSVVGDTLQSVVDTLTTPPDMQLAQGAALLIASNPALLRAVVGERSCPKPRCGYKMRRITITASKPECLEWDRFGRSVCDWLKGEETVNDFCVELKRTDIKK